MIIVLQYRSTEINEEKKVVTLINIDDFAIEIADELFIDCYQFVNQ